MTKPKSVTTHPVNLTEYIPGIELIDWVNVLRSEADFIIGEKPRTSIKEAEIEAANRILSWHDNAEEDLDVIKRVGLSNWIDHHRRAKTWATLRGLASKGITSLPLVPIES